MKTKNQSYLEKTIDYDNVTFNIEYEFYPAEKEVTYYSDMSGLPSSGADVEIHSIKICEFDVYDVLSQSVIDSLEDLIIEHHENED